MPYFGLLNLPMIRLVAALLLFSAFSVRAQNYVVTTKSDTLKGELRMLTYDRVDRVQIGSGKTKEVILAYQVRALMLDGQLYKPSRHESTVQLMKVLKSGYLSLYAYRMNNQTTYDGRYLVKMDGSSIELPNLTFKKSVSTYLEDCSSISSRVKEGELSRKDIDQIIDEYNKCIDAKGGASKEIVALTPEVAVPVENEKVAAAKSLLAQVEAADFAAKKDAVDLLKDIQSKLSKNEPVPNYLSDGLKSYLSSQPALQQGLEMLLALLKK